jgi:hypothetical protein
MKEHAMIDRATILALALLAGCDKGGDSAGGEEDPAEHACEHASESGMAVTAGATPETATAIAVEDEPYTVTLVDGKGGKIGFLEVESTEDQAALLFAGTADVVTSLWFDGKETMLPTAAPNEFCSGEIPEHWDLDLEPGTWTIGLGPAAVDSVWLMLVGGTHEHEE